ncbi:MAG: hypothetical protein WCK97_09915, partial [Actinomycetes bacterium]
DQQSRLDLQAERRRQVIQEQLGAQALARDDRTQALTFRARAALNRERNRNLKLLAALRSAQNKSS